MTPVSPETQAEMTPVSLAIWMVMRMVVRMVVRMVMIPASPVEMTRAAHRMTPEMPLMIRAVQGTTLSLPILAGSQQQSWLERRAAAAVPLRLPRPVCWRS